MLFEFFILGFVLIFVMFFCDFSKVKNLWLFIAVLFLTMSYFVRLVNIGIMSTNLFVVIAMVFVFLYIFSDWRDVKFCGAFSKILSILVIYIGLNLINIDFNMFFNLAWVLGVIVLVSVFNFYSITTDLFVVNVSLVGIEFVNALFLIKKLNFLVIFSREFVVVVVVLNGFFVLKNLLVKAVKLRYEKVC